MARKNTEEKKIYPGRGGAAKRAAILAIVALIFPAAAVYAKEENGGSIRVVLEDGQTGTSKEGVPLTCIKAADTEDGSFILVGKYKDSGVNLNRIETADDLEQAAERLAEWKEMETSRDNQVTVKKTDGDGIAVFSGLQEGVYLLKAETAGTYDKIAPFLVSVPFWDEEQNMMRYDVEAVPKHTPEIEGIPDTGVEETKLHFWTGAGILSVLAAVAGIFCVRRKNE